MAKEIEETFNAVLGGEAQINALDFARFLRANEMVYDGDYEIYYKNKLVCYIDMPNEQHRWWSIWTVGDYSSEYEGFTIDERTKEIAWANVVKCGNCDGVNCDPGKTEVIFGRKFTNVCNGIDSLAMRFVNPDAETLECVKELLKKMSRRLE